MSKWPPIFPRHFLYCFSLQAGVVGTSVIGITVMTVTLLLNAYEENQETWKVKLGQYILFGIYLAVMYGAFILGILGSFWEKSIYVRYGGLLIAGGAVLYLIMAIVSFVPNYKVIRFVCPGLRCPDHHWLLVDRWRRFMIVCDYPFVPRHDYAGIDEMPPPPPEPRGPMGPQEEGGDLKAGRWWNEAALLQVLNAVGREINIRTNRSMTVNETILDEGIWDILKGNVILAAFNGVENITEGSTTEENITEESTMEENITEESSTEENITEESTTESQNVTTDCISECTTDVDNNITSATNNNTELSSTEEGNTTTTEPKTMEPDMPTTTEDGETDKSPEMLLIVISVVYTILFLGYLAYSSIAFLSFSMELLTEWD